jgi:DNA replication protein DnaC
MAKRLTDAVPESLDAIVRRLEEFWDSPEGQRLARENAELDAADEAAREVERRSKRATRLMDMGMPRRVLELGALDRTEAVIQLAHALAISGGAIVVLSGSVGCGKTVAAGHWLYHARGGPYFSTAAALCRANRYEKVPAWSEASAAVIDDLGAEYADTKGAFQADLDEIIAHYHGQKKRLVITTNLRAKEFKQRYGERIASRIRECGQFVPLAGPDLRGNGVTA